MAALAGQMCNCLLSNQPMAARHWHTCTSLAHPIQPPPQHQPPASLLYPLDRRRSALPRRHCPRVRQLAEPRPVELAIQQLWDSVKVGRRVKPLRLLLIIHKHNVAVGRRRANQVQRLLQALHFLRAGRGARRSAAVAVGSGAEEARCCRVMP